MFNGFLRHKEKLIRSTIIFLFIQFILLTGGTSTMNNLKIFTKDFEAYKANREKAVFEFLLATESLRLESIKQNFINNSKGDLEKQIASTLNLPHTTKVFLFDRRSKQVIFPYDYKEDTEKTVDDKIFENLFFQNEDVLNEKYLINLKNDSNLSYKDAFDFNKYPIGTRNRVFIQKVILPPATEKATKSYIVAVSFDESLVRNLVGSGTINKLINQTDTFSAPLVLILAGVLFSTLIYSIYVIFLVSDFMVNDTKKY